MDTGHTIIRHQWVALPMPLAVLERVNVLGGVSPPFLLSPIGKAVISVTATHRMLILVVSWMMILLSFILLSKFQE